MVSEEFGDLRAAQHTPDLEKVVRTANQPLGFASDMFDFRSARRAGWREPDEEAQTDVLKE